MLSMERAAWELGVNESTLKRMIRAGRIQTCKQYKRRGVPSAEILRYIAQEMKRAGKTKAKATTAAVSVRNSVANDVATLRARRYSRQLLPPSTNRSVGSGTETVGTATSK